MADKQIKTRIQQKHDVAANWAKATNFIPKKGEIIIYDAEYNTAGVETTPVRFKIGNGSATVNALPFVKASDIVKLGGGATPSGTTGIEAAVCIDQVYANILEGASSNRNYFSQLMSRIESGQMLLMGVDFATETIIYITHITGLVENEVTTSQGTPVESGNNGVRHFIIAEKNVGSGSESEKILLWAEKAGVAFSKYRSAVSGDTETFSATVTAGWNSNYVNLTTGLCDFSTLSSGGDFVWMLMSTAMKGQDAGSTPTGNYFFAGSSFTIEYEAQIGQMAVLDYQLGGSYQKGYYIGSVNLETSTSSWKNYQIDTDVGATISFNTALKNSTIGACLSNICNLSPSGNCIVRTYGDSATTYKVVPILSDSVDGNGEWTLYAGAMLLGSSGSYYGLFKASNPLTLNDAFGDAATSIYYWNQWEHLSDTGAWTTNAESRKAKYVNFEALSLLYQYAMFGEYSIIKLPLRKVAEAQGSYAKAIAEAVQDKQDIITTSNKLSASLVSGLATVATSGSYNDLSDKPTIPSNVVQYTTQTLTDAQKTQARTNIGAGTSSFSGSYNDLTNKPTIPSAVTSINGLSGGTLTSPITLTGGDSATASKMILDANGQITDTSTATLFGRSSGNLIVGSGSYPTTLRGKQTRPTYNGNDMALKSDIPDVSGKANLSGGNIFKGNQQFVVDDSNSTIETFVVNDFGSGLDVIKVTAGAGLELEDGFTTSGFIDCQQGARVGDSNEFLSLNYSDINRPVLTISDGALLNLDGYTGQPGQVCTSSGDGTAPTWTTPAIKSATLTGTTLYLTIDSTATQSVTNQTSVYNDIY